MAKMSIFGNRLKCQEKASLCIKDPQTCPKRAWDDYLHPKGTLLQPRPKSKFCPFSLLNLQPKFSYVPYGCKYSPQALFFVIFGFFEQNRIFFIPSSPLSDKNSLSSIDGKESSFSPSVNQNSDFGGIVAERISGNRSEGGYL